MYFFQIFKHLQLGYCIILLIKPLNTILYIKIQETKANKGENVITKHGLHQNRHFKSKIKPM